MATKRTPTRKTAKKAPRKSSPPAPASAGSPRSPSTTPPRPNETGAPRQDRKTATGDSALAPGTTLTRTFKGQEIRVKVTAQGFEYEGETFTSISAVARHITGYQISGPVFFTQSRRSLPPL